MAALAELAAGRDIMPLSSGNQSRHERKAKRVISSRRAGPARPYLRRWYWTAAAEAVKFRAELRPLD
jgi:hypothetical protein